MNDTQGFELNGTVISWGQNKIEALFSFPSDTPEELTLWVINGTGGEEGRVDPIPVYDPIGIDQIIPESGTWGEGIEITIVGSHFSDDMGAWLFNEGLNELLTPVSLDYINQGQLGASFDLSGTSEPEYWRDYSVFVGYMDGYNTSLSDAFRVYQYRPHSIDSIDPNGGNTGIEVFIDITGSHFLNGASGKLVRPSYYDILAFNTTYVSENELECGFYLEDVAPGEWQLEVLNPDGQSSNAVTFTITEPQESSEPVHNLNTGISYSTIQGALNAPETLGGHTIIVDSGVYYESLSIGKSVFLIGNDTGSGKPVIRAEGLTAVTLNANGILFSGFILEDTDTGINVLSDYNTISNNSLTPRTNVGVYGIQIIGHHHNNIIQNTISGYNPSGGTGYALFLSLGSTYNVIEGNIGNDNKRGILLYSSSNSNIIANNFFARNIWDGICIWDSTNNTVYGNTLNSNNVGLKFWYATSGGNRIYQNNLINNSVNADTADSVNTWHSPEPVSYSYRGIAFTNYTGNYWSDADAPDENGDGIGDIPHSIPSIGLDSYPLVGPWDENQILPSVRPFAQFSANITSGNPPLAVQFLDESDCIDPLSWYWDFGDGNTSTEPSPLHVYPSVGTYSVALRVANASGIDWENKTNYIAVTPATPANQPPVLDYIGPRTRRKVSSSLSPWTATIRTRIRSTLMPPTFRKVPSSLLKTSGSPGLRRSDRTAPTS
ncbi:MAG: NosD domain-containing protein [Methanomicrobiales archaeon]|nr:NosD domain-containing protein [Methanomicrobiales archaeon]